MKMAQEMAFRLDDNLMDMNEMNTLTQMAPVLMDFVTVLCGKKLGAGTYRTVYEYNLDTNYVVKIEPLNTGQNMNEYMIWNQVQYFHGDLAWVKDWFAPVKWISPNGRILIMERTQETRMVRKNYVERPKKVPSFFTDVHHGNFGWIGKRLVCHDYAFPYRFMEFKKRFRKANW
tara:strand:- start:226 stop:747 length:522 start_codon:yes stop_codon:yes gene_type:complete